MSTTTSAPRFPFPYNSSQYHHPPSHDEGKGISLREPTAFAMNSCPMSNTLRTSDPMVHLQLINSSCQVGLDNRNTNTERSFYPSRESLLSETQTLSAAASKDPNFIVNSVQQQKHNAQVLHGQPQLTTMFQSYPTIPIYNSTINENNSSNSGACHISQHLIQPTETRTLPQVEWKQQQPITTGASHNQVIHGRSADVYSAALEKPAATRYDVNSGENLMLQNSYYPFLSVIDGPEGLSQISQSQQSFAAMKGSGNVSNIAGNMEAVKMAQFFKTKMCPWYPEHRCRMGNRCNWAHSSAELRPSVDLTNTKLCENLFKRGRCSNPHCRFAHSREDLRATTDVYKTSICVFWERGSCAAANSCRYAHGTIELRPKSLEEDTIVQVPPVPDTVIPSREAEKFQFSTHNVPSLYANAYRVGSTQSLISPTLPTTISTTPNTVPSTGHMFMQHPNTVTNTLAAGSDFVENHHQKTTILEQWNQLIESKRLLQHAEMLLKSHADHLLEGASNNIAVSGATTSSSNPNCSNTGEEKESNRTNMVTNSAVSQTPYTSSLSCNSGRISTQETVLPSSISLHDVQHLGDSTTPRRNASDQIGSIQGSSQDLMVVQSLESATEAIRNAIPPTTPNALNTTMHHNYGGSCHFSVSSLAQAQQENSNPRSFLSSVGAVRGIIPKSTWGGPDDFSKEKITEESEDHTRTYSDFNLLHRLRTATEDTPGLFYGASSVKNLLVYTMMSNNEELTRESEPAADLLRRLMMTTTIPQALKKDDANFSVCKQVDNSG